MPKNKPSSKLANSLIIETIGWIVVFVCNIIITDGNCYEKWYIYEVNFLGRGEQSAL